MTMINWEAYLNLKFCKTNPMTGNRPCDNGVTCTMCHTEAVQYEYVCWKIQQSKERANND